MSNSYLEVFIKNIIAQIKEAGYDDPTFEIINYQYGDEVLKFKLYKQEQWDELLSKETDAQKLSQKLGIGTQSDFKIVQDNVLYYVKLIK